jgi:hypothetical protein
MQLSHPDGGVVLQLFDAAGGLLTTYGYAEADLEEVTEAVSAAEAARVGVEDRVGVPEATGLPEAPTTAVAVSVATGS